MKLSTFVLVAAALFGVASCQGRKDESGGNASTLKDGKPVGVDMRGMKVENLTHLKSDPLDSTPSSELMRMGSFLRAQSQRSLLRGVDRDDDDCPRVSRSAFTASMDRDGEFRDVIPVTEYNVEQDDRFLSDASPFDERDSPRYMEPERFTPFNAPTQPIVYYEQSRQGEINGAPPKFPPYNQIRATRNDGNTQNYPGNTPYVQYFPTYFARGPSGPTPRCIQFPGQPSVDPFRARYLQPGYPVQPQVGFPRQPLYCLPPPPPTAYRYTMS